MPYGEKEGSVPSSTYYNHVRQSYEVGLKYGVEMPAPMADMVKTFMGDPRSFTQLTLSLETSDKLFDVIEDPGYRNLVTENSRFAIPPFDRMLIVYNRHHNESDGVTTYFEEGVRLITELLLVKRTKVGFNMHRAGMSFNNYNVLIDGSEFLYPAICSMDLETGKFVPGRINYKDAPMLHAVTEEQYKEKATNHCFIRSLMLMTLFLLIYKRPNYVHSVPASHKMVGNKRVPYAAHKTIDLKPFEPKEVISRLAPPTGTHASPRAHEVMGHWVHYGFNRLCAHEWEREVLEEDDPRRRVRENGTEIVRHVCKHCGAKRTFRDNFIRGDSSKGWVRHDYVA